NPEEAGRTCREAGERGGRGKEGGRGRSAVRHRQATEQRVGKGRQGVGGSGQRGEKAVEERTVDPEDHWRAGGTGQAPGRRAAGVQAGGDRAAGAPGEDLPADR